MNVTKKIITLKELIVEHKHLNTCECDTCMGACDELDPYCGDCFACEQKTDDATWWEHNKGDLN
jgi:hypothetical protein